MIIFDHNARLTYKYLSTWGHDLRKLVVLTPNSCCKYVQNCWLKSSSSSSWVCWSKHTFFLAMSLCLHVQGLWGHPSSTVWNQQHGYEEQGGEGQTSHIPQRETLAILRDFGWEQLQLWEAFPLSCKEACWVHSLRPVNLNIAATLWYIIRPVCLLLLLWLHPLFCGSLHRRKYNLVISFLSSSLLCKSYCCKMLVFSYS